MYGIECVQSVVSSVAGAGFSVLKRDDTGAWWKRDNIDSPGGLSLAGSVNALGN